MYAKTIIILALCFLIVIVTGCSLWGKKGASKGPADDSALQDKSPDKAPELSKAGTIAASKLSWLIIGCAAGLGVSAVLLFSGSKWAIPLAAASIVTLITAITLSQHFILISRIGLGIFLAGLAVLIWQVWFNRKKWTLDKTALVQAVRTAEITKPELSVESLIKIFGKGTKKGLAANIQSPETEKIISEIRATDPAIKAVGTANG